LIDMSANNPMIGGHQQMLHAPGANYQSNGGPSDYAGLQSAAMRSGNWQQNPNANSNSNSNGGVRNYNSPPDLSFSHSSHNTSGDLVASPTRTQYYANAAGPSGSVGPESTLGGMTTTAKLQSQLDEDETEAGPSGYVEDPQVGDRSDYWATEQFMMESSMGHDLTGPIAGPSTYPGAYDEFADQSN
jgi:hypothetical protein